MFYYNCTGQHWMSSSWNAMIYSSFQIEHRPGHGSCFKTAKMGVFTHGIAQADGCRFIDYRWNLFLVIHNIRQKQGSSEISARNRFQPATKAHSSVNFVIAKSTSRSLRRLPSSPSCDSVIAKHTTLRAEPPYPWKTRLGNAQYPKLLLQSLSAVNQIKLLDWKTRYVLKLYRWRRLGLSMY